MDLWFNLKRSNRRVISAKATFDDKTIEDIATLFLPSFCSLNDDWEQSAEKRNMR
jgi:hypothetical protein